MNNGTRPARGWNTAGVVASFFLPFVFSALVQAAGTPLTAPDIMKRNEEAHRLTDSIADAEIDTRGADAVPHDKKFSFTRKLEADGSHFQTLTRFREPAEVRGEAILFLEHGSDSNNEVLLYLPAYKKVRRVEGQSQSGSFMGSAFSYSDIASPHVDDYHYKILREEDAAWVIESQPATDAVRERNGVSRALTWVRKDSFMEVKGESYDADDKLLKQFTATELTEVDPKNHKWMAFHLEMKNLKSANATTLQFSHVKVNQGISDALFTEANLSKER